jgi:hypothetical protein
LNPLRSLKGRVAVWSGGTFLLLFAILFGVLLTLNARNNRQDLEVILYAEAESLASYYASTQRLDFPELQMLEEDTPLPIWLRIRSQEETLAATPGFPDLPQAKTQVTDLGSLNLVENDSGGRFGVVHHDVWSESDLVVDAVSSLDFLADCQRRLALALGLAALLLVPLAAIGGRFLAVRALQPVEDLIASASKIDSLSLTERLEAPGAVS